MTGYLITILTLSALMAMVGLGLNLQWGQCGLVNFGVAGFYALGAYAYALVALSGAGLAVAVLSALVLGAFASAMLAILSIRLTDDFLAIVTLGFAEAVRLVVMNETWLTGGSSGIPGVPRPLAELVPHTAYETFFCGLCLAAVGLTFLILQAVTMSPFGRTLRAIREDDLVASTLGKNVLSFRVRAFALGGAIIAGAGALHAMYYTYIDPAQFGTVLTAYAFMAVIAGGRGSHIGLLVGAFALIALLEGTRFMNDLLPMIDAGRLAALRLMLIGAGLLALIIYRPQGFLPEHKLLSRKFQRRKGCSTPMGTVNQEGNAS